MAPELRRPVTGSVMADDIRDDTPRALVHVYFAVRPAKLDFTKSMIFGSMKRQFYLEHYDPQRWAVGKESLRDARRDPRSL
jgi:hypothetical protein